MIEICSVTTLLWRRWNKIIISLAVKVSKRPKANKLSLLEGRIMWFFYIGGKNPKYQFEIGAWWGGYRGSLKVLTQNALELLLITNWLERPNFIHCRTKIFVKSFFCLFLSLLNYFWLIHFHIHLLYQPYAGLASYMCSITLEMAKGGSSYSHMPGPGIIIYLLLILRPFQL